MTEEKRGRMHLYQGDGKGKTTAACGLAVRAAGAGMRVVMVQFLKGMASSETAPMEQLGIRIFRGMPTEKFVFQMSDAEKMETRAAQTELLRAALAETADLLILDEACAAWELNMVDRELLKKAVTERPAGQEIVLTGRNPAEWMHEAADYETEMRSVKHPYEHGDAARKGIEY